ncbi:hypothetical protein N4X81_005002 [Salmonella enterica]|nr:hypothetical protein [Salmonella enterica]
MSGHQRILVGQAGRHQTQALPATAVKQLYHSPNITGQARQQWIYLSPIAVKCRIEVSQANES